MFINKLKQVMLACLTGLAVAAFWQPHHTQAQTWNEAIKAIASDRAAIDYFGYSVSISGDYAIVGALLKTKMPLLPLAIHKVMPARLIFLNETARATGARNKSW